MNQNYVITATAPLLRPGIEIEVTVSRGYAAQAVEELLEVVREVNEREAERREGPLPHQEYLDALHKARSRTRTPENPNFDK